MAIPQPYLDSIVEDMKRKRAEAQPSKDLSKLTVAELKDLASERGVVLQDGLKKAEIVEHLS